MPISANTIWKFKAFIATAISQSLGEQISKSGLTIDSIKEIQGGYHFSGTFRLFLQEENLRYEANLTDLGDIISLTINNRKIIS